MADAPFRDEGADAAEVRLNRLLNLILEAAVEALGFDAATVRPATATTWRPLSPPNSA
jgi:hypothetical protein